MDGTASHPVSSRPSSSYPRGSSATPRRAGARTSMLKTAHFQKDVCSATYSKILGLIACVSRDSVIRLWDPERYFTLQKGKFYDVLIDGHWTHN